MWGREGGFRALSCMVSYILATERKSVRLQQPCIENEESVIGNYLFDKKKHRRSKKNNTHFLEDKGNEEKRERRKQWLKQ